MISPRRKLTTNFVLSEFIRGDLDGWKALSEPYRVRLVERLGRLCDELETARIHLGGPFGITSGWRSAAHNAAVGGVPSSDHVKGLACDFQRPGLTPDQVYKHLKVIAERGVLYVDQVILYPHHVHLGIGPRMRGEFFVARKA